jgi:hypothetical protein
VHYLELAVPAVVAVDIEGLKTMEEALSRVQLKTKPRVVLIEDGKTTGQKGRLMVGSWADNRYGAAD